MKTALIGTGKVAHLHAAALKNLPASDFVAVCGTNEARTGEFAARYGVRAFTDLTRMLDSGVEMLCVCTPHPLHAPHALAAIEAGVHVLVEKPLAATLWDCDLILNAAQKRGVKIGTVSQRRFYPPCQRIKSAIEAGKIGRPILASATMLSWRDAAYYRSDAWRGSWQGEGGGVLVNQAPHQLDLLRWFMGPIVQVSAFCGNFNHPEIEVEDTAVAILRFQNGAFGQICASNSQNPALWSKIALHGSNGASIGVQTDGGAMFIAGVSSIQEMPFNDIWTIADEANQLEHWRAQDAKFWAQIEPETHFHALQIADFLAAIAENRAPLVSGEGGRATVELFSAIYRSQQSGAPVNLPLEAQTNDLDARAALNCANFNT